MLSHLPMIMTPNKKINLKKGDIFLIAFLMLLAAALFLIRGSANGGTAEVTIDGETVYKTELASVKEKRDVTLPNGVVITEEPGAVYFSSSPCKGHDCIKTGKLTRAGQCAVCLPEKTVIKITGKTDADAPDAIT